MAADERTALLTPSTQDVHHGTSTGEPTTTPGGAQDISSRPRRQPLLATLSSVSIPKVNIPKAHDSQTIVALLCALVFVVTMANGFTAIPMTALLQDAVCRAHYQRFTLVPSPDMSSPTVAAPPTREQCKIPAVQSRVAYIFAADQVVTSVIGFLAAFPWGVAADRLGRKPVFALSLFGIALGISFIMLVLSFPAVFAPEMLALQSLFVVIGGGQAVLVGILLSMISDVVVESKRATAFTRLHVASIAGSLISPALASSMTAVTGPWPVPWVAVAALFSGAVVFLFIPESLPDHKRNHSTSSGPDPSSSPEDQPRTIAEHFRHILTQLRTSLSILKSRHLIVLLFTAMLTYPLSYATLTFLVQFLAERYNLPFSKIGFVQASNGLVQAFVALFILPYLSLYTLRATTPRLFRFGNEQVRDLSFARTSFFCVSLGCLVMSLAVHLPTFVVGLLIVGLGAAGTSLLRSLMSLYVDPEHTSRLYSLVGMVELVSNAYGGPMLAATFSQGLFWGEPWVGMPYLCVAILTGAASVVLLFVRVPAQGKTVDEETRTRRDEYHD